MSKEVNIRLRGRRVAEAKLLLFHKVFFSLSALQANTTQQQIGGCLEVKMC